MAEKFTTVDAYIGSFPTEVRQVLDEVRRTIRRAIPDAEETISYQIPTFKRRDRSATAPTTKGRVNHMNVYCFELSFTAPPGEEIIDALYEAGWDDATVSLDPATGGPGVAAFDREASSAVEAVASAIRQGRSAGVEITAVSEDLVTLSEIAERTGRTLATADHWAAGRRGPGTFPEPKVRRPRASLYSWAQVVFWLHEHGLADVSLADVETAQICEVADSLVRAHRLKYQLTPRDRRLLAGAVS